MNLLNLINYIVGLLVGFMIGVVLTNRWWLKRSRKTMELLDMAALLVARANHQLKKPKRIEGDEWKDADL